MLLFALSLIASSFLLFQIQPLIGKYILPWFGSSPSVWSASLLFFQSLLTAGYAYAYAITRRISIRWQAYFHITIISLSIIVLVLGYMFWSSPLLPDRTWQPKPGSDPFLGVFRILLVSVGFPYFILSTNSTLLQAWFSHLFKTNSPYRLYALSNAASLIGLISYPFIIEPLLPISIQARWWAAGYIVFFFSIIALSLRLILQNVNRNSTLTSYDNLQWIESERFNRVLWVLLPAIASSLLLATTNQITQEIAVIPFLWILPLSLYLLSFIFCFENDRWYGRSRFTLILIASAGVYGLMLSKGPLLDIRIQIASFTLIFFVCAMICHGELARLRPHPSRLPSYYLSLSVGGAVGGLFVSLVAPVIFKDYWEFPFSLLLCFGTLIALHIFRRGDKGWILTGLESIGLAVVMLWIMNYTFIDIKAVLRNSVMIERNFFGVLRVREVLIGEDEDPAYRLINGITIHGLQFKDPSKRNLTTTYYTEASGAGIAFQYYPVKSEKLRVAVLGLGTGTLAAYGRKGDLIRFYEINPAVVEIAQGEGGYFSFLKDSQAHIEVSIGDARLSLEREFLVNGSQNFDLIFLDTFTSDSIPVHLITREAFQLYLNHLKNNGILAVHISNIHLKLEPIVYQLANHFHLKTGLVASGKTREGSSPSVWILLTADPDFFEQTDLRHLLVDPQLESEGFTLWTDDYSNLFQILR